MQVLCRITGAAEIPCDVFKIDPPELVPINLHLPRLGVGASRVWEDHRSHLICAFPDRNLGALQFHTAPGGAAYRANRGK